MNRFKSGKKQFGIGIILCGTLLGYATQAQPSLSVGIEIPLPSIEIRAESDFYEPLGAQGEWVDVGTYGRCWRPGHVDRDWRPYCNGNWERTEAGWYWASDEPWAWATYHYGRWDFTDQSGWYWVPQTQWAPAWVSWHQGGGYLGWAPLQPSVRISAGGFVGFNEASISPRAFVFVKEGQFMSPIRPAMVVINNTTIIHNSRPMANTRMTGTVVINEGPATAVIEKATGHKVQAVQIRDLRQKSEAAVAKRPSPASIGEKRVQTPVENRPAAREPNKQAIEKKAPAKSVGKEPQRPAGEKPGEGERREPKQAEKEHEERPK